MTKEQFIQLFLANDYEQIIYMYHLENGKVKMSKMGCIGCVYLLPISINAILDFIILHYLSKFTITRVFDKTGKLIKIF